jgi:hypothetical protein
LLHISDVAEEAALSSQPAQSQTAEILEHYFAECFVGNVWR